MAPPPWWWAFREREKPCLARNFCAKARLKSGKRGLLISLDEHPAQIIRNAETLGLDLQEQIDSGMIHVFYDSPQELEIDSHFAHIVRTIEEYDIQRLVIDGVTQLQHRARRSARLPRFFSRPGGLQQIPLDDHVFQL